MGKLQQLSHLTAVTALKQETYEVAKVMKKKKKKGGANLLYHLGKTGLRTFF